MSELKSTLVIAADASGVETGVQSAKRSLSTLGKAASDAGKIGSQGLASIGDGGDVAAKKVDNATKSLIGSIQRTTAALEGGGRASVEYYKLLASQRGVDANALAPYLAQLDQVQKKQALANVALQATVPVMQQVGMSAKATAAAMRNVPAQFTDIVTSLQGGQNPLTVLLQQGGQLKDMFGGVGGAVRALGTYALGLINPFTLTAGAVIALGLAYNGGAKEATEFNKALILSGNAAGATVNQFLGAQKAIAGIAGTKGNAAEALQALASTGLVAGNNLERFGLVAVQMQRVAGVAFAETASNFAALAKTPLEASLKLNESLRYLTISTYEQIKALQERGKLEEAGALAQNAYASASESAIKKLTDNMGTLDRAIKGTTDFFKGMWDAAFDIGRPESLDDKIKAAAARLEDIQKNGSGGLVNVATLGAPNANTGASVAEQRAKAVLDALRDEKKFGELAATNAAAQAKALTNRKAFDDASTQYQSDSVKRAKELAVIENLGAAANADPKAIAQAKAAINAKYDSGASLAAIQRTETLREEIVKRAQSNIDTARATGSLNEIAALEASNKLQLDNLEGKKRFVDQEIALAKRKQNPEKELVQLRAQLFTLDEQITTATVEGTNAIIEAKAKQKKAIDAVIDAERTQFQAEVTANQVAESKAREQGRLAVDAYAKSIGEANELVAIELGLMGKNAQARDIALAQYRIELALKEQIKAIDSQPGFDEADRIEQRAKARAAAATASNSVLTKSALDEWTKASDSINASLTDAFLNASQSGLNVFQSLAKEAENIFKNLVLRPAISAAVQPVASTITNALGLGGASAGQGGLGGLSSIANLGSSLGTSISTTIADILPSSISAGLGLSSSSLIASNALIAGGGASGAAAASAAAAAGNAGALGGLGGLAAVPGLGLAIGGIALLGSLFGGGGFKSSGTTGNAGASFDPTGQRTSSYVVDATTAATEAVINGLQSNYASTAARLGIGAVATQFSYGGNTGAQGESPNFALGGGALRSGSFYQGETKLSDEALSLASSRAIFAALQGSDLPRYLVGVFDGLDAGQLSQDQITNALNTASAFKALHDQLQDLPFAQLKDLSYTAAAGLAAVSGGLDKFQTNLASYYDKFYSDAEKTANTTASVTKALAGLGLAMPALDQNARTAYRALVDAQDVTTTAGQQAYAILLAVSGAFDQIATAADNAAKAAADLKSAWQSTTDSIFDEVKRIRALSGTSSATLASAQAQFAITTAQASAGDQSAAKLLPGLSQALLTLAEASATSLTELRRIQGQTASSLSSTGTSLASRYGLTVPSFDVGTNLVPQDMLALIHKGEAIVPSAYNPAFNASAGNGDLIAEVRALREQVAQLQASNQDTANNTRKTAQTLVRVTRDGESMLTEAA